MKTTTTLITASVCTTALAWSASPLADDDFITLASTTSTENSGLFDAIIPTFTEATGITVNTAFVDKGMVERLQAEQVDVDAIFAANDMTAIGVMVALRDMGVDVPTQVAVAGFDNIPLARLISPGLTTMAVDIADMGARGINRLVALIDGEAVPQMELRQPGLIIRTSSQLSAA